MKLEMEEIIANTKSILQKEKERKEVQKIRRKRDKAEDLQIVALKKQLKEKERKAEALKREIRDKKNLIEGAYQYQLIREKEDEFKDLDREHRRLLVERFVSFPFRLWICVKIAVILIIYSNIPKPVNLR